MISRIEEGFIRRLSTLPDDTRRLLVAAAAEPLGDATLLWRAAGVLGLGPNAGDAAYGTNLALLATASTSNIFQNLPDWGALEGH